ncbi:MAG: hypothetical protein QM775_08960 [Pirellulales bacterium]
MIRRNFNPSASAWTTVQLRYERLQQRLAALPDPARGRALAEYVGDHDRFLPRSLLQASPAELADLSFDHLGRLPHVGLTKIRNLLDLLERVVGELRAADDCIQDAVVDDGATAATHEVTSARWSQWTSRLRNHAWSHEAVGRVVGRLSDLPRSIWLVPVSAFAELTLAELHQLKSYGPQRIRAIAATLESLHRALLEAERSPGMSVTVGPAYLTKLEAWLLDVIGEGRAPAAAEVLARLIAPLVELVRHDLGDSPADAVAEKFPALRCAATGSSEARSDARSVSYVRKHQLRRLAAASLAVRWPRGAKLLAALTALAERTSADDELRALLATARMLLPPSEASDDE